tara:strand:- start:1071 stop:1298 length:228 start_codon:yes stop_codon:yes gene_type:complete
VFIPKEIQKGSERYAKDRYVYPSDTFWATLQWWRKGVNDTHEMKASQLKVGKNEGQKKLYRRGLQIPATFRIKTQ